MKVIAEVHADGFARFRCPRPGCANQLKVSCARVGWVTCPRPECRLGFQMGLPTSAGEFAQEQLSVARLAVIRQESDVRPRRSIDYVPRERAEEIVRVAAVKHGAKGSLKKLGSLHPRLVANGKAAFAQEMSDSDEGCGAFTTFCKRPCL